MPTSYTAPIQDGTITTLRDFAMLCAREFGATISMRDAPLDTQIPERFEPSGHNQRLLVKARARLVKLQEMSPIQAQREMQQEYSAAMAQWRDRTWEHARQSVRYKNMVDQVKAWSAPTKEHVELKEFMLGQLEGSIEFDLGGRWFTMPRLNRWPNWLRAHIDATKREIEFFARQAREDQARADSDTQWVQALRASL